MSGVNNQGVQTQLGADVSNWQGKIDLRGLDFVFAKCSQGTTYKDPFFAGNRDAAAKNHQLFGAYHFLTRGNGKAQAQFFVHLVSITGGFNDVGAAVDVEYQDRNGNGPTLQDVSDFIAEFTRLVPGKQLLIYTGAFYWKGHLGNPTAFANHPLWDAAYIRGSGSPQTLIKGVTPNYFIKYGGWQHHTIRQFSSSGVVNGRSGIDLDEFEGSYVGLANVLHVGYDPPNIHQTSPQPANPKTHIAVDGIVGAQTISAIEHVLLAHKMIGAQEVTGVFTADVRQALLAYLHADNVQGDPDHAAQVFDTRLQKYLISKGFDCKVTHDWDKQTTIALQKAINHGKF